MGSNLAKFFPVYYFKQSFPHLSSSGSNLSTMAWGTKLSLRMMCVQSPKMDILYSSLVSITQLLSFSCFRTRKMLFGRFSSSAKKVCSPQRDSAPYDPGPFPTSNNVHTQRSRHCTAPTSFPYSRPTRALGVGLPDTFLVGNMSSNTGSPTRRITRIELALIHFYEQKMHRPRLPGRKTSETSFSTITAMIKTCPRASSQVVYREN